VLVAPDLFVVPLDEARRLDWDALRTVLLAEIWRPGDRFPRFEEVALEWSPAGVVEPFTLALDDLFRPI
jgi:hypothetical protein